MSGTQEFDFFKSWAPCRKDSPDRQDSTLRVKTGTLQLQLIRDKTGEREFFCKISQFQDFTTSTEKPDKYEQK